MIYSSYEQSYGTFWYDYSNIDAVDFYTKMAYSKGDFREVTQLRHDVLYGTNVDKDRFRAGLKSLLPFQREWLDNKSERTAKTEADLRIEDMRNQFLNSARGVI